MTKEEKLELIADILEVEVEELNDEAVLEDFEAWDSVAVLSIISAVNEETGHFLHASEITALKTVADLLPLFDREG